MQLVRIVTPNSVYAIGQHLPVPPGYTVEPFLIAAIELVEEITGEGEEQDVTQFVRFICLPDKDSGEKGPPSEPEEPTLTQFGSREDFAIAYQQYEQEMVGYMAQKKYCEQAWQAHIDKIAFLAKIPITDDMRFEYLIMQNELEEQAVDSDSQQEATDVESQ